MDLLMDLGGSFADVRTDSTTGKEYGRYWIDL
jgi:hypothetical protein